MDLERLKGIFYLICAFSFAGTSVIAGRLLNGQMGPFTITGVSLLLGILCLLPVAWRGILSAIRLMTLRDWTLLGLQALFGVFLFRMFLLFGLQHTSAGEAGIITGATPAVTVMLARVVLKESIHRTKLAGILSTIGGILLIQELLSPGAKPSIMHLAGNVLVLCTAISESIFNILSRAAAVTTERTQREHLHPMAQTAIVSVIALLLCLVPAILEDPISSLSTIGVEAWLALVWYGPVVTSLAFICWYAGIKRCLASTAAALSGMMPFTSMLLSVLVLGEHAGWPQWAGGMMVIIGMILIGGSDNQEHKPSEQNGASSKRSKRLTAHASDSNGKVFEG